MEFGARVKKLRIEKGLTREEFCGVNQKFLFAN